MLEPLLHKLNNMRVILATTSKQRIEVLSKTPLKFEVCGSNFEENLDINKYTFTDYVEETARGKVQNVYNKLKNDLNPPDLIIGLDTMVCCDNAMFGKPKDKSEATEIIKRLIGSNSPHIVYTGVVLLYKGKTVSFTESTKVFMTKLSDEEILAYVETGEPIGKAGAYAIQGLAASFVYKIEGDYYNVIGLPLCRIATELKKLVV